MKKFLMSFRNYSLMLGLSFILLSCITTVVTGNSEVSPTGETPTPGETPIPLPGVDLDFSFWDCSCSGNFQKLDIFINIPSGELPFNINGQEPVNNRLVTFPVSLPVSSFPLTITSFDNRKYEANIEVPPPSSCQPPKDCNGGGGNNGNNCQNVDKNDCHLKEVKQTVCTDWAGNSGNCKKREDIVTYEEVCTKIVEVVCN